MGLFARQLLCAVLLIGIGGAALSATETRVFTLISTDPQPLLSSLRQLYGDQASFALQGDKLTVRAEQALLKDIGDTITQLDAPRPGLRISFSSDPPREGVKRYGTDSEQGLTAVAGKTVWLSHRELRQQLRLNRYAMGVEEVPADEKSLALTPVVSGSRVSVEVSYRYREGNTLRETNTTVTGQLGQWLAVFGEAVSEGRKRYSTAAPAEQLFLKVERIQPASD